jgi:hypothetical protein
MWPGVISRSPCDEATQGAASPRSRESRTAASADGARLRAAWIASSQALLANDGETGSLIFGRGLTKMRDLQVETLNLSHLALLAMTESAFVA